MKDMDNFYALIGDFKKEDMLIFINLSYAFGGII